MFNVNDFEFIRCDEEPERVEALNAEPARLLSLHAYTGLIKGDRLIKVHETCVARGAGTPNLTWQPIITVTETVITRDNPKTYSFKYVAGWSECCAGKFVKGYTNLWHKNELPDGYRDNYRWYII